MLFFLRPFILFWGVQGWPIWLTLCFTLMFRRGWSGSLLFFYSKEVSTLLYLSFLVYLISFVCWEEIKVLFWVVVWGSILFFLSFSLLIIFIRFEICLLPVVFIILAWGKQTERVSALFYFLLYAMLRAFPFFFLGYVCLRWGWIYYAEEEEEVFFVEPY